MQFGEEEFFVFEAEGVCGVEIGEAVRELSIRPGNKTPLAWLLSIQKRDVLSKGRGRHTSNSHISDCISHSPRVSGWRSGVVRQLRDDSSLTCML